MSQRRQIKGCTSLRQCYHSDTFFKLPQQDNFTSSKFAPQTFTNKTTIGLPSSTPVWLLTILLSRSTKAAPQCSRGTNASSKSRNLYHPLEVRQSSMSFSHRRPLPPEMSLSWTAQYGLNWTTSVPAQGATIVYSGNWQACSAGQSYNLDSIGEWVVNDNNPNADANSLNIGSNGYSMPVNVIGIRVPASGSQYVFFSSYRTTFLRYWLTGQ